MPKVIDLNPNGRLPGDFATLATQWQLRLQARGYAERTCYAYSRDLQELQDFLARQDITLVQLIGWREIERFMDERMLHFNASPRSAARKLSAIKMFLAWCRAMSILKHDPCRDVKIRYTPEQVIAPEESELLKLLASIPKDTVMGIRDRALFRLMFDTALRVGQVVSMDLPDPANPPACVLDLERLQTRVRRKGMGSHVAGFDMVTSAWVRAYLNVRERFKPSPDDRAVFISKQGRRMTRQAIHYRLKAYAKKQGLNGMYCHKFRHRRAGSVVEKLGLEHGQKLLGHRNKSTTANIYGAHADEVVRAQIREQCSLGGVA